MAHTPLFCICRKPFDDGAFYLGCDGCDDWLHGKCVGINEFEAARISKYFCPGCRTASARQSARGSSKLSLKRRFPTTANDHTRLVQPASAEETKPMICRPNKEVCSFPSSRGPPFVGLPNPGGDLCSLNSVILAMYLALTRTGLNFSEALIRDEQSGRVAEEAASLLWAISEANACLRRAPTAIVQPHCFALARSLRATHPGRFPSGQQHDAEDVLLSIVAEFGVDDLGLEAKAALEHVSGRFMGACHENLECLSCHRTSSRREAFADVIISCTGIGDSVRAALLRAWGTECLTGPDMVLCENCGVKCEATRKVSPLQIPQVFVVLLRPPATREHSTHRLIKSAYKASEIEINLNLNGLIPGFAGSNQWSLCSVVLHTGTTFNTGHYTTALNCAQGKSFEGPRKWALVDDDQTRWLSDEELGCIGLLPQSHESPGKNAASSTSTPYLLFYAANDSSIRNA